MYSYTTVVLVKQQHKPELWQLFTLCILDLRHKHRSSCIGDAAPCCRWGMFVIAQRAAQQAQVVEGQDQDHHATKSNAANPPEGSRQSQTIRDLTVYQSINKHSSHCGLYQQTVKASSRKRALLHLLIQPKKHISTETRMGTMKIEHKAY